MFSAGTRAADTSAWLRPLGLGEILDRAVTTCVRGIAPLAVILCAYEIPIQVITYFASGSNRAMMRSLASAIEASAHGRHVDPASVFAVPATSASTFVLSLAIIAIELAVGPFRAGALTEALAALSLGRIATARDAFAVGLRRYVHVLGLDVVFVLLLGAIYSIVWIVAFVGFLVALAASAIPWLAIAFGIVVGVALLVVVVALLGVGIVTIGMATACCVCERAPFVAALQRGLRLTFVSGAWRRSTMLGLVEVAVYAGLLVLTLSGQLLFVGFLRVPVVFALWNLVTGMIGLAFLNAVSVTYYIDQRVRLEGLDVHIAAERLAAMAGAPP